MVPETVVAKSSMVPEAMICDIVVASIALLSYKPIILGSPANNIGGIVHIFKVHFLTRIAIDYAENHLHNRLVIRKQST